MSLADSIFLLTATVGLSAVLIIILRRKGLVEFEWKDGSIKFRIQTDDE
ncbi:UNVERIFIED_ORG: hypothetical protein GGD51_005147 [Rhizobium esperanzae]